MSADDRTSAVRTWLITGAGRGLGRAFAEEAIAAGDRVVAAARTLEAVEDLAVAHPAAVVPLRLDLSDRDVVFGAVRSAVEQVGRIDVLVNNAGYGLTGAIEEISEEQLRRQMEVNFFGLTWCTQAVLPVMRAQLSGHIFQISSVGGVLAFAGTGAYNASKWAVEGMSEALALEVAPFGIRVTLIEPGPFRSDWNGSSQDRAEPMAAYDEVLAEPREVYSGAHAFTQPGDPAKAAAALRQVLESDDPPLRLLLGRKAATIGPERIEGRLAEWERWEAVARAADFDAGPLPEPAA
jgi:NAD(P)-dependent dehydrogenase (short-subunit alcohol dehydrogenase family)